MKSNRSFYSKIVLPDLKKQSHWLRPQYLKNTYLEVMCFETCQVPGHLGWAAAYD